MTRPNEIHQFSFGPITAYSFNKDRTQVAICPNNNEVQIHQKSSGNWDLIHTLVEHDKLVTSIDWAPETNQLVTCSQDRNAYVWKLDSATNKWKPTLVLLRINRAATFVRWSPKEDKFAVASGARSISICYFDEEYDWWTAKLLKRPIRSTVLSLDWHPNNVIIAAGCADFKAYVLSAFIKGVDQKPANTAWGNKFPFNTVCGEYSNGSGGWIHSVSFSPSGDALAFTGHDSQLSIVYPGVGVQKIRVTNLPYLSLVWLSEDKLLAAGHDCAPALFERQDNQEWKFSKVIDVGKKKVVGESTAFNRFRDMDTRGTSSHSDDSKFTIHQNTITSIRVHSGPNDNVESVSTSGLDGRIVIWDLQNLESQFKRLHV